MPGGLDVNLLKAGTGPVTVSVDPDLAAVQASVKGFVTIYNQFVDSTATLTKFDPATNQRGILQGDGSAHV